MKKKWIKCVITFVLCISMLPVSLSSWAESGINNKIKGSSGQSSYSSGARDLLYTAGNFRKIEQPASGDFYSQPWTAYINAPMGHSVYVFDYWGMADENLFDSAFHGSRVTVLAVHGACSCILYYTQDYQLRAGWVRSSFLESWYPGVEYSIGWMLDSNVTNVGDPAMRWSQDNFVRTGRKYSVLQEPVHNCVNFTLDYQLTHRYDAEISEVVGPRDVYINDGTGWTLVGRFDYPDVSACHVNISLPDPTTIAAVAVIAQCKYPDLYVCRQSLLDVKCLNNGSVNFSPASSSAPRNGGIAPGTFNGNLRDYSNVPFYYANASSELTEGDILFTASYAIDDSINRPWVEGVSGPGIGESLTLYFGRTESIDILSLRLGYARDSSLYYLNNRPKTIRFSFSDGTSFDCTCADRNEEQIVELGKTINTDYVNMTIMDVYYGEANDTCIYLVKAYRA